MLKEIESKKELDGIAAEEKDVILLFFYSTVSENSIAALDEFKKVATDNEDAILLTVNVANIKEIHKEYGITSVPTVITIRDGKKGKVIVGKQTKSIYENLLHSSSFSNSAENGDVQKRVVVYTTPTCPHCTTIKNYLRKMRIQYREVNVAADQKAAEELMRRSGQTGVPQTDIGGQIVIGANISEINKLLGIRGD